MSADIRTELAAYELRSGRRLTFDHVEHVEHEAHTLDVVSHARGRRYVVRVPLAAVGVLRQALEAFERRVRPEDLK